MNLNHLNQPIKQLINYIYSQITSNHSNSIHDFIKSYPDLYTNRIHNFIHNLISQANTLHNSPILPPYILKQIIIILTLPLPLHTINLIKNLNYQKQPLTTHLYLSLSPIYPNFHLYPHLLPHLSLKQLSNLIANLFLLLHPNTIPTPQNTKLTLYSNLTLIHSLQNQKLFIDPTDLPECTPLALLHLHPTIQYIINSQSYHLLHKYPILLTLLPFSIIYHSTKYFPLKRYQPHLNTTPTTQLNTKTHPTKQIHTQKLTQKLLNKIKKIIPSHNSNHNTNHNSIHNPNHIIPLTSQLLLYSTKLNTLTPLILFIIKSLLYIPTHLLPSLLPKQTAQTLLALIALNAHKILSISPCKYYLNNLINTLTYITNN